MATRFTRKVNNAELILEETGMNTSIAGWEKDDWEKNWFLFDLSPFLFFKTVVKLGADWSLTGNEWKLAFIAPKLQLKS